MRLRALLELLRDFLGDQLLVIEPGPDDPDTAGRFIKVTPGPGLGLTTEMLFDQVTYQVEAVGTQGSYDDAESLAWRVDQFFLRFESQIVDGSRVNPGGRTGNPNVLLVDNARRWHFACSYTLHVQSALTA